MLNIVKFFGSIKNCCIFVADKQLKINLMSINKVLKNKDLHNSDINSLSYHFIKNRISEAQICAYDLLGYSDDVYYQRCVNDLIAILSSVKNRVSFTQDFLNYGK